MEYFCYTTQTFYEMYLPYVLQIADYLVDSEKTTARFKLMELDIKLIELFQGSSPTLTPFVTNYILILDTSYVLHITISFEITHKFN